MKTVFGQPCSNVKLDDLPNVCLVTDPEQSRRILKAVHAGQRAALKSMSERERRRDLVFLGCVVFFLALAGCGTDGYKGPIQTSDGQRMEEPDYNY